MTLLVDTVLQEPCIRPGTMVPGHVQLVCGARPVKIDHVALSIETGCGLVFMRHRVASGVRLAAGRSRSVSFLLPLPWETPVTRPASAATVGLRTQIATAEGTDTSDPVPMAIHPLLGHRRFLEATERLGFRFEGAGIARRRLPGVRRSVPFFQEFTFRADAGAPGALRAALVANPVGVDVVLTAGDDRRHLMVRHHDNGSSDPAAAVTAWLSGRGRMLSRS